MNRRGNPLPPIEDSSSPYFLHPSDNPSIQLVPQVLTGSNYINWSRSITTALLAKNKLAFVNGVLPRPAEDDLLFPAWLRCNSMVVSWLRNSVSPQICSSVMYIDDAHEVWSDLRVRFSQSDSARSYQLRQRIMSLAQGQDDISTYFTNLRIIWDEYKHSQPVAWCTCTTCRCRSASRWHDYQEQECTMQFLIGLNHTFTQIRSSILSMVPLPSLSKVFSLVTQKERQRSIDSNISPSVAPGVPNVSPFQSPMSEQAYSANAATSPSFNRGRMCSHCGKTNHTVDKCFSLHGFPPGFGRGKSRFNMKDTNGDKAVHMVENNSDDSCDNIGVSTPASMPTTEQFQQLIHVMNQLAATVTLSPSPQSTSSSATPTQSPANTFSPFTGTILSLPFIVHVTFPQPIWLLDTGATHHVCCDPSLFTTLSPISNTSVNLPNGSSVPVTHTGHISLTPTISLSLVLCVQSHLCKLPVHLFVLFCNLHSQLH